MCQYFHKKFYCNSGTSDQVDIKARGVDSEVNYKIWNLTQQL